MRGRVYYCLNKSNRTPKTNGGNDENYQFSM